MYFSVVCDCAFCCEEARLADQPLFVDWGGEAGRMAGWCGAGGGLGGVRERG